MDSQNQKENNVAFSENAPAPKSGAPAPAARRGMHPALRVLTYVLVFLLGAGAAVSAIVGAVFYGYDRVPVNSVLEVVYPDYREILSEDFAEKTLSQMVLQLASGNIQTLADVREITPCVDSLLDRLEEALAEFGIVPDREELCRVRWEDLGTYVSENLVRYVHLDRLLSVNASSSDLEKYLVYGVEGEDYTVLNGEIVMKEGKSVHTLGTLLDPDERKALLDGMRLGDVMEITEDSELILRSLKDTKISALSEKMDTLLLCEVVEIGEESSQALLSLKDTPVSKIGDRLDTLTLGEAVKITEDSERLLKRLKDTEIRNLTEEVRELTVTDVVEIREDSAHIVLTLKDTKLSALNTRLEALTLSEVVKLDESSPLILRTLAGSRLENIDEDVNALTMEQVLGEEAFGHNVVLDAIRSSRLDTVADDIETLTVNELFRDEIYDADGSVKGAWRYILMEDGTEQVTYLKDIDRLSGRISANVNRATLRELQTDGMIAVTNPADLEKTVLADGQRVKLGDMTVSRLVEYILRYVH